MKIKLETLLLELGSPGKYQICIFLLLAFNYFPVVFNHIVMAFIGSPPQHECYDSGMEDSLTHLSNISLESNVSGQKQMFDRAVYGKCMSTYYLDDYSNTSEQINCDSSAHGRWRFSGSESTIVSEVMCFVWRKKCHPIYIFIILHVIHHFKISANLKSMVRLWKTLWYRCWKKITYEDFQKLADMEIDFKRHQKIIIIIIFHYFLDGCVQIYELVIPYKITSLVISIKSCVLG